MGAYLSKPVTEKVSSDENNENLVCGASSMQGWRIYQEDAHNAILDYDKNRSLFAVYDGHGGSEVAAYTAVELPNFIKKVDAYNKEQFSQALSDAFLEFDATLIEPEVLVILKDIAGSRDQDDSDYDGEEVDHLCREASMPLEEVMAKYSEDCSVHFQSPNIRPKKMGCSSTEGCSSLISDLNESTDSSDINSSLDISCSNVNDSKSDLEVESNLSPLKPSSSPPSHKSPHIEDSSSLCNGEPEAINEENKLINHSESINGEKDPPHINGSIKDEGGGLTPKDMKESCEPEETEKLKEEETKVNLADVKDSKTEAKQNDDEEEEKIETLNGELTSIEETPKKGKAKAKGKGLINNSLVQAIRIVQRRENKRKAAEKAEEIYKQIQGVDDEDSNSDDDEDEDENFENVCTHGFEENSSSEEDEDDDDSETNDDEEEEEDEEESDSCEDDSQYAEYPMSVREEPGYDSGCTACVALVNGNELYVANVGDSRCVVCRDGKALDMSIDHKPEDEPEATRITKAGGRITNDGRVNGGLNLSRALGDHSYKQNKNQPPEEQMISPLPDVRSLTLTSEDSFMVIACDGIWNSMSSQEVCDFISERLETHPKLSKIAEEMFDHCISPDSHGDGTGCDNMTCIIVKFQELSLNPEGGKRTCEKDDLVPDSDPQEKRCRLEAE